MQPLSDYSRLSLNQITTEQLSLPEAVDSCARLGIPFISIWRHKLAETGLQNAARLVRDAGIKVSSLCRGGMFPAPTPAERKNRIEDNRRAIDECAELGTNVLVLVCGPAEGCSLAEARSMVAEGIAELVPYAKARGVKLGIEPLHPMMAAERSVVLTLAQANDLAARFDPAAVGVVADVYHIWWDPQLDAEIDRARGRILGFHVSDWLVPTTSTLQGRGMMGDGVIAIREIRRLVERAGYTGPIEVEVINRDLWTLPGEQVLTQMKERYLAHV